MKTTMQYTSTEETSGLSEASFSFDADSQEYMFHILRNQLYSNKILAVIREYSTNAWDIHKETGVKTPISVRLPSLLVPKFEVRDFGPGLSEEDIYNVYVKYCKSTKRDRNLATGEKGIGSKSAFCYSDTFNITSHHNGVKKSYTAYLDSTGLGKIMKLGEELTTENGIQISIPVAQEDFLTFVFTAKVFYKYFNPVPNFTGYRAKEVQDFVEEPLPLAEISNSIIKYRKTNAPSVLVMGCVPYPLDVNKLSKLTEEEKALLASNAIVDAPIGAVDTTASRESLEYTARTQTFLKAIAQAAQKEFSKRFAEAFSNATSIYEHRKLYFDYRNEMVSLIGATSDNAEQFANGILGRYSTYNNVKIEETTQMISSGGPSVRILCKENKTKKAHTWLKFGCVNKDWRLGSDYVLQVGFGPMILINDVKTSANVRATKLAQEKGWDLPTSPHSHYEDMVTTHAVLILSGTDDQIKTWLNENQLTGIKLYKLSDVKIERAKQKSRQAKPRTVMDGYTLYRRQEEVSLKEYEGFWCEIYRGKIVETSTTRALETVLLAFKDEEFEEFAFEKAKLMFPDQDEPLKNVLLVTESDSKKLKGNVFKYDLFVQKLFLEYLVHKQTGTSYEELAATGFLSTSALNETYCNFIRDIKNQLDNLNCPKISYGYQQIEEAERLCAMATDPDFQTWLKIARFVYRTHGTREYGHTELVQMANLRERFPMFSYVPFRMYGQHQEKLARDMAEIITLVSTKDITNGT